MQQGMHAAANMLGDDKGRGNLARDRESGEFSIWCLNDGRVAGALSVDRSEDLAEARRMLADGVDVSGVKTQIADPGSDLSTIS